LNRQQYLHVHFNELYILNSYTNATGSYRFKNGQTCSVSHHLYIICPKCLPPARMQARRRWRYVSNRTFNEQRDSVYSFLMRHLSWDLRSWYDLETDISSM